MSDTSPTVPSPCVNLCALDEHNVCLGCRRTMEEIVRWSSMDDAARARVLERIERARRAGAVE